MTQMRTSESKVDTSGVPFAITDRCFIPREGHFDRTSRVGDWRAVPSGRRSLGR